MDILSLVCLFLIRLVRLLNREVVCSRPAARPARFAESPLVFLKERSIRAKQQPVGADAAILDLRAVRVGPQVTAILALIVRGLLPRGRVAFQLEEAHLLDGGGGYFVLLRGHVLGVLLVSQAVVGERKGQEVRGADHALAEVRRRG